MLLPHIRMCCELVRVEHASSSQSLAGVSKSIFSALSCEMFWAWFSGTGRLVTSEWSQPVHFFFRESLDISYL